MEQIERYRGCLLGLATGDALGTPLEFSSRGSFAPVDEMMGGGPWGLQPGQSSKLYSPIPGYWEENPLAPEIYSIAIGYYKQRDASQIRATGYVARSLEAALWALHNTSTFKEGCLLAVNLGDDADTTGAVYGERGIPQSWSKKLAQRELIESFAEQLFLLSQTTS